MHIELKTWLQLGAVLNQHSGIGCINKPSACGMALGNLIILIALNCNVVIDIQTDATLVQVGNYRIWTYLVLTQAHVPT